MSNPDQWLRPRAVFHAGRMTEGVSLRVAAGRVVELGAAPADARPLPLDGVVSPGFVDLQVNGGGDVLFNTTPTAAGIAAIIAAHRRFGTTGILPTVITDAPEVMDRATDAVLAAWGHAGLLGIHIEGPHLSVARRGTHRADYIRPLDGATLANVARLRQAGVPVLITLAPENASSDDIARLAAMGARVSIGHSDATADQTRAAFDAGARVVTHLFNAMSPMLNRAPGVTGAAINSQAHCGIICDGIHVADEMVGLAIRARPLPDRMFLVSDAMPTVGGGGRFRLYDMEVHLDEGRLVNDEGSLAGAHTTMADSVARLIGVVGVAPETALRMAVTVPATLMGHEGLDRLTGRSLTDLIVLDGDWKFAGTVAAQIGATVPARP